MARCAWLPQQATQKELAEQHQVDDGLGSADASDGMIAATWGHPGATANPGTAAGGDPAGSTESAAQSQIDYQPTPAASAAADS
jgi:hypothetical protein